ncbi:HAMP domain-containing sensor histidine kinase [Paenibacillus qinlingensis]|uniref:histidine kinase n=1 Tax=Paenibacillus qinlingensis TaxID=1837343 RepID=A0ABU1NYM7_9BACL|nr:HAMP domain-containing sensor histidine kinase [Paenibacillus qinlingensis]MDR6552580.1 signal transduction histidine kinase [Paenibacillus qinlingensis]
MATKWRSKSLSLALLVGVFVMWTLTLFAATNVYKNSVYFGEDAYFKSGAFSREINAIYENIQLYYLEAPHFNEKTPEEQLGNNEYYNVKRDAERTVQDRINNLEQKYSQRIETARNHETNADVDRLEAERDTKLAELNKEMDATLQLKLKAAIAAKQKQFSAAKTSLDNRLKSLYYVVKNLKTGETYSNIAPEALQKLRDQQAFIYTLDLPKIDEPNRFSYQMNVDQIKATYYILNPSQGTGIIQSDYLSYESMKNQAQATVYLFIVIAALTIGLTYTARTYQTGEISLMNIQTEIRKHFPLDVRAWTTFIATAALFGILMECELYYWSSTYISMYQITIVLIASALLVIVCSGFRGAVALLRHPEYLAQQWSSSLTASFWQTVKDTLERRGLIFKLIVFMAILGIMGFLPVCIVASSGEEVVIVFTFVWYILFLLVVLPYMMRKIKQLRAIIKGVEQMSQGNFDVTLPAKGKGQLSRMAMNINNLKYGLQLSLEKTRVSDRLKTELITNVSHDLKTPLTSIISYVDLLKKEGLSAEQSTHYLEVLDRKTQRLKVLIEDLFEASKMASGATELYWEKVDVSALLTQALAEFSDKIEASTLTFRVNVQSPHMYALLDGKKTWRVFENLIGNALKYALPGTRVYVTLTENTERVILVIQNISLHELNYDVEELFERFKRGDQSRGTEGSGLGLAIAKSIVELQGGTLTIDIDGDQFKVIAEFEKREMLAAPQE